MAVTLFQCVLQLIVFSGILLTKNMTKFRIPITYDDLPSSHKIVKVQIRIYKGFSLNVALVFTNSWVRTLKPRLQS